MSKQEFLDLLRARLAGLPKQDVEERLGFYGEMIDDRIEEGLSEEEAVADIGSTDEIAEQILADIPLVKIAKEKIKPKRRIKAWEIVLLALGSPIWLSLLAAVFVVVLAVYAVLWSLVATVWTVFAAFAVFSVGGLAAGVIFAVQGNIFTGLAVIGVSVTCAGLAILLFFGSRGATKGIVWITKMIALGIKKCFVGKENAQ